MSPAPPSQVGVTVEDYKYTPPVINANPGQTIHLTITNKGTEEHGMEFDLPSGVVTLPSHVRPKETERFDITAPKQAGTYYFHCPVGNHYAMGMEGELIVH